MAKASHKGHFIRSKRAAEKIGKSKCAKAVCVVRTEYDEQLSESHIFSSYQLQFIWVGHSAIIRLCYYIILLGYSNFVSFSVTSDVLRITLPKLMTG